MEFGKTVIRVTKAKVEKIAQTLLLQSERGKASECCLVIKNNVPAVGLHQK